MRIDNNTRIPDAAQTGQTKPSSSVVAGSGSGLASDTAKLSTGQSAVQALAAKVNELPEVRQDRVAALASAIRNGSYQVTPEQTADALMVHMVQGPMG